MFSPEYLARMVLAELPINKDKITVPKKKRKKKERTESDIRDVEEAVVILVFFVDATHQGSSGREDLIHKNEDGLLRGELDTLANNVDKLAHREISRNEVLLLVDGSDIRLLDLFADNLWRR